MYVEKRRSLEVLWQSQLQERYEHAYRQAQFHKNLDKLF
jgi:hypothetical protein